MKGHEIRDHLPREGLESRDLHGGLSEGLEIRDLTP